MQIFLMNKINYKNVLKLCPVTVTTLIFKVFHEARTIVRLSAGGTCVKNK